MSNNLPEIKPALVAQKLNAKVSEQNLQLVQLEVLAEALRDERDGYRTQLDETSAERDALKAEVAALKDAPTVAKITEL